MSKADAGTAVATLDDIDPDNVQGAHRNTCTMRCVVGLCCHGVFLLTLHAELGLSSVVYWLEVAGSA